MGAQANWHLAELDLEDPLGDEPDPFDMPIEEVGDPIDLSDVRGRLELRLKELLDREGKLYNRGVTCPLRDRTDTTCLGCPVNKAADTEHRLGPLCRCGREQEQVLTGLAVEATGFDPEDHGYSA